MPQESRILLASEDTFEFRKDKNSSSPDVFKHLTVTN